MTQSSSTKPLRMEPALRAADPQLLERLAERVRTHQPNFFLFGHMTSTGTAVAYLLDAICNRNRPKDRRTNFRSFFANAGTEALGGALRTAWRAASHERLRHFPHTLLFDPSRLLRDYFNPCGREEGHELLPGISFVEELGAVARRREEIQPAVVVIRAEPGMPVDVCRELFEVCRRTGTLTILDESLVDFREQGFFCEELHADIVVFGEALADRRMPFGAFLMSERAYRPWSTNATYKLHATTFGGGQTVLSVVLDTLRTQWPPAADEQEVLASIASSRRARRRLYRKHVNKWAPFGFSLSGFDFDLLEASGSTLRTSSGVEFLDCVGCAGANFRGHNPPDLVDVLRSHDPTHDYWSDLREQLHELTGLPCAFPGVSGASVVEHALILAQLAAGERTRIVTFKDNFAGTTPVALNCSTAYGPNEPYGLCRDVVFFDPFSPDTPDALRRELASGQVGLVWLELIRGVDLRRLPDDIFRVINEERQTGGYLVGVDEVLTGAFRTGQFLFSQGRLADPDIVTLAKGLSDMFIPFGVTLVTSALHAAARDRNPELVDALERRLLNQLGSHVAVNALRFAVNHDMGKHVQRVGKRLREGLTEVLRSVDYLGEVRCEVRGEGLLLCLDWSDATSYARLLVSSRLSERGAVLLNRLQCKPPLTISESEIDEIVRRVAQALRGTTQLGNRTRGLVRILSALVIDRVLR